MLCGLQVHLSKKCVFQNTKSPWYSHNDTSCTGHGGAAGGLRGRGGGRRQAGGDKETRPRPGAQYLKLYCLLDFTVEVVFPTAVADPTQACLVQRKSHRYSGAVTSLVLTSTGSEALVCTDNCQVVLSSATPCLSGRYSALTT